MPSGNLYGHLSREVKGCVVFVVLQVDVGTLLHEEHGQPEVAAEAGCKHEAVLF
jgi:hypothetical protein